MAARCLKCGYHLETASNDGQLQCFQCCYIALKRIISLPDDFEEELYPKIMAIVKEALNLPLDNYDVRKFEEALLELENA